jgi:hypothetical protein
VKPSTLEGSTSLTVFHPQFEAEAANRENKYLLAILQRKGVDILRKVPGNATFKDIVGKLNGRD